MQPLYQNLNFLQLLVVWRSGSALVLINDVNLHRARLVLEWLTVSGFNFRARHLYRYVTSHPGQLSLAIHSCNEYQPKGSDAMRLGSKGRYGLCVGGR